ncbi:hypothetical protein HZA87_00855 [Candidatus Uhrbacteria bacterium]|nr:hypothetical protein [Candidatus Uhrbacteria bacterium]
MGKFDNPKGSRDFYSGRFNERDVLGEFRSNAAGLRALQDEAGERGYIARGRAIDLIRQHTQEDPTNPRKPFAKELRLAVIDELGLEEDDDLDRIRFYSAVGTPLDVFHGVDGWIEFVPEKGSIQMITLDVMLDPGKVSHKADVIVQQFPDPVEDEVAFLEAVEGYASEVADRLRPSVEAMLRQRGQRSIP